MKKILFLLLSGSLVLVAASCSDNSAGAKGGAADSAASKTAVSGDFKVNAGASIVGWLGSKAAYNHAGTVKIQSGSLHVENGNITQGEYVIDMSTIMENGLGTMNDQKKVDDLVGHLKSPDFFDVAQFPTATFKITGSAPGGENGATHTIKGDLTIKGITKPISFPAKMTVSENEVKGSALFKVNRADFDVKYGSDKFFDNLGDKVISNDIDFSVDLVANK
jgi:polyisoprenoid-binding protein YceI